MSVIFTRPTKLIGDASENNESIWNAVGNPIVYKWQYYDGIVDQINNNAGDAQLQFTGVDISSSFNVGNDAWVGVDGYYDFFEITGVAFSGGNTLVDLDVAYNGTGTGYVIELDNYGTFYVDVDLYRADNDVSLGVTLRGYPSLSGTNVGLITVDVSAIIKAYLSAELDIDLTESTEVFEDSNGYLSTYIIYTETISSVEQTPVDDSADPIISLFGARQIPSIYGGNMGQYVTFADGSPLGLFLNKFTRPKVWRGYPFLISVIVGDLGAQSLLNVNYLDADGVSAGGANSDNVPDVAGALYTFDITKILAIPDNAVSVDLTFFSLTGLTEVSETITCDIVDPCENSIMVMARNSLGGILQWVFDGSSEKSPDYGNDIKAIRRVLFAENVTENEWDSLQDFIRLGDIYRDNITEFTSDTIKTTSRIGHQVYVVDTDGSKIGVIAIPTRNRTETKQKKHKFEFEIEYPEEFVP